jgi:nitrite reductase/ring-hydroxylating ferredoxin subunit
LRPEGWHAVGPLEEVPEGRLHEAVVGGEMMLLVRRGDAVHAFAAHCPHKFTPLVDGRLDGVRLTCPMHAATFDVTTGRALPGQEWAGQLPTYPTRVREGVVEVQVP